LRNAGFSQLPVMENDRLVGVLTEDDIIRHVFECPELMNAAVRDAMQTSFVSVRKDLELQHLVSILHAQPYAAVMDGDAFYGLITRADVLNQLRKQVQQGMPRQS
jgi:cystathionine beta-synthase